MPDKTIITCAVTGGADTAHRNPAVPVTPVQIARASLDAEKAGAAIVHIHVRDEATGKASMDLALYREVVARIRDAGSNLVINLTTGPGARFVPGDVEPVTMDESSTMHAPETRLEHVEALRPDICSLDVATMNFGENAMVNVPKHLRAMAARIREVGVKPELEVFDTGHVLLANQLIKEGYLDEPPLYQLCLGIPWGAPATPEGMSFMKSLLPPRARFGPGSGSRGARFRWSPRRACLAVMPGSDWRIICISPVASWPAAMRNWSSGRSRSSKALAPPPPRRTRPDEYSASAIMNFRNPTAREAICDYRGFDWQESSGNRSILGNWPSGRHFDGALRRHRGGQPFGR